MDGIAKPEYIVTPSNGWFSEAFLNCLEFSNRAIDGLTKPEYTAQIARAPASDNDSVINL